ncbi:MAG: type II secretion system F family protein [Candidatus Pacebacteria bacterium]|jgi:type II secretory pathway component PulF|nr:type II secretion system F family protein [Candidatus Paceibacterota bacterium]MDD5535448.1 type II secretion system F family protein [Candidatus Paceibacterota bacterium]
MLFHYLAQDAKGRIKEGNVNQPNTQGVLDYLATQKLKPLSVKPLMLENEKKDIFAFRRTLSLTDKVFLTKYLSLMLKVGTDLFSAIDILIQDFESGSARRFLLETRANLEKGKPFWNTFAQHPEYFSSVITNLIKAGETSGNLEATLSQVSINLERDRNLQTKVKSSLIYPVALLAMSLFMIVFLVIFAIPKLGEMFLSTGQTVPTYTRIVLSTGMFLNRNILIVLPLIIGIPIGLFYYFAKTKKGKELFSSFMEKVPIARDLVQKMALERFCSVLSNLIKAGMPIIQAIEVTSGAVGHPKYEAALLRVAKEHLSKGLSIGESFKKETIFPAVVSNLLAIGEKAGHTEEILKTLSEFYEVEIEGALKTLVSMIEPLLLLFLGVVVGGIALSLIVPVYQLVGQF